MRTMEFKMERNGLIEIGDKAVVTEGVLPNSYYYTIEPAIAMSGNYRTAERLKSKEGIVKEIKETSKGFYIIAEFDEP